MVAGVAGKKNLLADVSNCGDISRLYIEDYRRPVRRFTVQATEKAVSAAIPQRP